MDRGAWQATVHGVAKSPTSLKRLSTHAQALYVHNEAGKDETGDLGGGHFLRNHICCAERAWGCPREIPKEDT